MDDYRNTFDGEGRAGYMSTKKVFENGKIETAGDVDVVEVWLVAGLTYRFVSRGNTEYTIRPQFELYNDAGELIIVAHDVSDIITEAEIISYTAKRSGLYYVSISAGESQTGDYSMGVAVRPRGAPAANLSGTIKSDAIVGSDAGDGIRGWGGADRLIGRSGDDLLFGGTGDDSIFGAEGSDKVVGGRGDDFLSGDSGADYLYGGPGDDTYQLYGSDPGRDRLMHFEIGGDLIDLRGIDANENDFRNRDQAFQLGTERGVGHLWVVNSGGGNTHVRGNTDGDAEYELEIIIVDGEVRASQYSASDFEL